MHLSISTGLSARLLTCLSVILSFCLSVCQHVVCSPSQLPSTHTPTHPHTQTYDSLTLTIHHPSADDPPSSLLTQSFCLPWRVIRFEFESIQMVEINGMPGRQSPTEQDNM